MVEKFCSRSHGHPLPGVRSIAMISRKREISREGVIDHLLQEHQALCRKTRAHPSETNRTAGSFRRSVGDTIIASQRGERLREAIQGQKLDCFAASTPRNEDTT